MRFLLFAFAVILITGCSNDEFGDRLLPDHDEFSSIDSFDVMNVEYAENFDIRKSEGGFTLSIIDPNEQTVEKEFTIPINKPLKLISLTSTVNGMCSLLDAQNAIVGISSTDYLYDDQLKARSESGLIAEFGDESNYSLEKIIASGADIVLYSGFGDKFPNQEKLEKLGFILIPVYDWREVHPLGKAEWIKLIGVLSGKIEASKKFFDHVVQEYQTVQEKVSDLNTESPTVISGNLFGDTWYSPAGDSYMARIIQDAGGDYVYKETLGTGSVERSIEQILKDNSSTEIWINPGMSSLSAISKVNPHAKNLKAFDNVYCYSKNMNLFWERSAAEPHHLLTDLIQIFHPDLYPEKETYFYGKVE